MNNEKTISEYLDYCEQQYQKLLPEYHLESEIRLYKNIINNIQTNPDKTNEVKKVAIENFTPRLVKMEEELKTLRSKAAGALG